MLSLLLPALAVRAYDQSYVCEGLVTGDPMCVGAALAAECFSCGNAAANFTATVGTACGGFVGAGCGKGFACVDDTRDDCDPDEGGADCPGVCARRCVSAGDCAADSLNFCAQSKWSGGVKVCLAKCEDPALAACAEASVTDDCPAQLACDDPCVCPEVFKPVCGADGVTYSNMCFLNCAGVELAHAGECAKAPGLCDVTKCPAVKCRPSPDCDSVGGADVPNACVRVSATRCAWAHNPCGMFCVCPNLTVIAGGGDCGERKLCDNDYGCPLAGCREFSCAETGGVNVPNECYQSLKDPTQCEWGHGGCGLLCACPDGSIITKGKCKGFAAVVARE